MICNECHHSPSERFDSAGTECSCKCHDFADVVDVLIYAGAGLGLVVVAWVLWVLLI